MLRALAILLGIATPLAGAQAKTDPAALEVARNWLRVVERGDAQALAKTMAVPFTYATTNKVKRCERTASSEKDLSSWLTCIRKNDKLLMEAIRQGEVMPSDPPNVESRALKALTSKIPGAGKWIEAYINGDGVTFTCRFLLLGGSVAAFLLDAEFENG
ncbi:MAG TPA: hypothetical protein VJ801_03415 [Polyangia bacterium]|jgi:hypothetical protein|nr:hypothetical protein [Polyangia bacterium]